MKNDSKIVAIMQPTYMPWMGYFSMIDKVDEFIFLDNVQLVGRSWQVRNKIKLNDREKMLTIPVKKTEKRENRIIATTEYAGEEWKESHLGTIRMAYRKAVYFDEVFEFLEKLYRIKDSSIGNLNERFIQAIARCIGITTPFFRSSNMLCEGKKDELLVNLCKQRNAKRYLSAQGSAAYIESVIPGGEFTNNQIDLFYHNYEHPIYQQQGEQFLEYIGIYDLLFNVGFERSLEVIRSGNREDYSYIKFRRICMGLA
mgnify:CR=1 FL=1